MEIRICNIKGLLQKASYLTGPPTNALLLTKFHWIDIIVKCVNIIRFFFMRKQLRSGVFVFIYFC